MKNLFNVSGLLLAILFAACTDIPIENPEQESLNATRAAADLEGKDYYWSGGRKIYLDADYTKMIVGFDSEEQSQDFVATISKANPFVGRAMALVDVRDADVEQKISASKAVKNKIFANTYSGYDDAPFYMTGEIVMQPKEGVFVEDILAKHEVDAEAVNKTDVGIVVRLKDWSMILSTANAIYESGMVDWCHPDFISQDEKATNDQYFQYQYYLKNTGQTGGTAGVDINVEPAWAISTGTGIRVAVVDDGVEDHDDLAGRVLDGFTPKNPNGNYNNGGKGRPTSTGDHGQACAGIIAASHNSGNNSYIAGVAPGVVIIPINKYYGGETVTDNAAAIEYAWNPNKGNADVISNSWSYRNGPPYNADVFEQQINNAVNLGRLRNGVRRGCVVVFSAGNDSNSSTVNYPGYLSNVIAVGAVNKYGSIWYYSNRGTGLDVVAPSGGVPGDVYTLDRMGAYGENSGNYRTNFNGTSAAAPQVAGVAALMLSANPNLTGKQVVDIIEGTAQKVRQGTGAGYYNYATTSGRPNGTWNNEMGYGLVDAYEAVSAASFSASLPRLISGPRGTVVQRQEAYHYVGSVPSGATFSGWTITPSTGTITVGTGDSAYIKFSTAGQYTVIAKFILPGNVPYVISQTVEVLSSPPSTPYIVVNPPGAQWYPGAFFQVVVRGPRQPGVFYEWWGGSYIDYFDYSDVLSGQYYVDLIPPFYGFGQEYMTVKCTAILNGVRSEESNELYLTLDWDWNDYRSAPANNQGGDSLKVTNRQIPAGRRSSVE